MLVILLLVLVLRIQQMERVLLRLVRVILHLMSLPSPLAQTTLLLVLPLLQKEEEQKQLLMQHTQRDTTPRQASSVLTRKVVQQ